MTAKIKNTQSETHLEGKGNSDKAKVKSAIKKLKKLKGKISDEKDIKEKKLKKQTESNGKKKKIKSLKRQVGKLLKKEKDVAGDLKKLKKVREALKEGTDNLPDAVQEVVAGEPALNDTIVLEELLGSEPTLTSETTRIEEDNPTQNDSEHKSVDHPAKAAIAYIRKLTNIAPINSYIKGDKRPTVVKAAMSRKNRLGKKPV
jgi:hypothetical protein